MSLVRKDDIARAERRCRLCGNLDDVSLEVERRFFSCSALRGYPFPVKGTTVSQIFFSDLVGVSLDLRWGGDILVLEEIPPPCWGDVGRDYGHSSRCTNTPPICRWVISSSGRGGRFHSLLWRWSMLPPKQGRWFLPRRDNVTPSPVETAFPQRGAMCALRVDSSL